MSSYMIRFSVNHRSNLDITSLQFSLAGFGDLCHISGQCRTRNVRQSDLVLVHLTNSLHQCRHKVGLGVLVVASSTLRWSSLSRLDPGVALSGSCSSRWQPESDPQTSLKFFFSTSVRVVNWVKVVSSVWIS